MSLMDLIFPLIASISLTSLCLIALPLPRSVKAKKWGKRDIRKMERQLPLFLDSVASSLLVGNSLQRSLETAAENDQTQLGTFFEAILLKVRSGMTLDMSLRLQAGELNSGSMSLALLSMASCYRSGSNLIESLSLLSTLCREREILRKKILSRTAQSRTQGYVIMFVPLLFTFLLYIVSPQNMLPVLKTETGRALLLSAAVLQGIGALMIRAMLKQEILG